MMSDQGRIVWHDLMTTSPEVSEKFFCELFGWQVKELDMGPGGKYRMLSAGGTDIGGVVPTTHGAPSHWMSYVAVDDVDAACDRATSSGGTVPVPPTDIPDIGRFAVVQDPTGGTISPFKTASEYSVQATPAHGHFCWEEFLTNDTNAAKAFYGEVLGWANYEMDLPDGMKYTIFKGGDRDRAGTMPMPAEAGAPPHWLSYVFVDDLDATAQRITELGGKIFVEPRDIPNIGRFAVGADPTGAMFAIYHSTKTTQS